ncbi:hypothetical protein ACET3X_001709 [Alternaria dauci]|uniref:Uncharacterized protein n=1 Tax=Alternaria dauci TaxID=48095 RepID=A0ABR3UY34_9PLEO
MAQKKAKRYRSYSIHVTETVALQIHRTQQAKDAKLGKRRKAVAKREKAVESDRILQQNEQAEYEQAIELFRVEVVEEAKNMKTLRKELLDNDAIKSRLRQDIMSELETEMMEKRSSWQIAQNKKREELNNEKRAFQLERDAWKEEKDLAISKVIKDEWVSQGYEKGLSEGKIFKSKEQYLLGYHYGARNANKKTAKQNLEDRYNDGLRAGKEEMSKQAKQEMERFKDITADFVHELVRTSVREAEDKLAEKFRVWMRERENAIHCNSRAYGLYEGAVNQIRRQNNVGGSEQEEDALTNIIAVTMADQIVVATAMGGWDKTCWHNTTLPRSILSPDSEVLKKSRFYKVLMPKLTEQCGKAAERVELAKKEQEKQKQAHAARVEAEWAARLPIVVKEPLENEEAEDMSDKEMVATFLKNIRDQ